MKNIFFDLPKEAPEGFKLVEVMVREKRGVLIYEKRKELIRAKIKKKRGN